MTPASTQLTLAGSRDAGSAPIRIAAAVVLLGISASWCALAWLGRGVLNTNPSLGYTEPSPIITALWIADAAGSLILITLPLAILGVMLAASALLKHTLARTGQRAWRTTALTLALVAPIPAALMYLVPERSLITANPARGQPRFPAGSAAESASRSAADSTHALRCLIYNTGVSDADPVDQADALRDPHPDVALVLEPSIPFQRAWREGRLPALREAFPHHLARGWVDGNLDPAYLLSRWPIERFEPVHDLGIMLAPVPDSTGSTPPPVPVQDQILAGIVRRPHELGGPFFVVGTHLPSPRNAARWIRGNTIAAATTAMIRAAHEQLPELSADRTMDRMPIVVLADLNAPPGSFRDRLWRTPVAVAPDAITADNFPAGQYASGTVRLRRAKPLLIPRGTFPTWLPWPLRISIDDVYHNDELVVTSWSAFDPSLSDHAAVLVELESAQPADE